MRPAILIGVLAAGLTALGALLPPPAVVDGRVAAVAATHRLPTAEARELLARGDAARAELGSEPGKELRDRVAAVEVDEAVGRAYYAAHPELFGGRPFEACWPAIRQILAVDAVGSSLN